MPENIKLHVRPAWFQLLGPPKEKEKGEDESKEGLLTTVAASSWSIPMWAVHTMFRSSANLGKKLQILGINSVSSWTEVIAASLSPPFLFYLLVIKLLNLRVS